ncbi:MAG: glycoside hydrolase family 31 protein [Anaerolineales bacterium]|nr:glycoside hydrolase family 31 protein [Anaerolineales bacterium]
MKIFDLLRTLRFIGWENPSRAILYSIMRDRQDRHLIRALKSDAPRWEPPGKILSAAPTDHGAEFTFEQAKLEILFLAEDVVRVSWRPGEPPVPYAIQERYWPGAQPALSETAQNWILAAGKVSAHITPSGSVTWLLDEQVIRHEDDPLRQRKTWRHRSPLPETAAVYGLGGRTRAVNLRGGAYRLWNRDPGGSYGRDDDPLYLNVPMMLVLHDETCHVVFYENPYDGVISIRDEIDLQFHGGMLRYYLCFGDLEQVLQRYSDLTGRALLPPRWALGFHQSRWGYRTEDDVRDVLQGFREHDLPLSAIHLDIDYMDGYRVFTTDPHRFPNLKSLSEQAQAQDVKLVSIIDPGVKIDRGYRLFRDGLQAEAFCMLQNERVARAPVWPGWVHFPDFTNPSTRTWWSSQYPRLLKHGISGIWHDMNEPAAFSAWGDATLPLSTRHALEGKGGQHTQAHNLYGLLMNRSGLEALRLHRPELRPFILSRSGWAGNQRYAWNWTGDVESTWDGLQVTLNLLLGMSLSGIVFTGSDIGGFSGDPTPELMVRWMQLAAFTPFFRTHSSAISAPREPWRFDDPYRSAMRAMLQLRYRMLPYLYTLAWQTSEAGLPLIRPLFWEDPSNEAYREIEDQFFLGSNLLIAPVLQEGASSREVTLPEGSWYSFWDDTRSPGPAVITVETPLDVIPVFVRGGCLLPLIGETLELHIYPGASKVTRNLLFSDDGDGYGPHRIDTFLLDQKRTSLEIQWQTEGEFPFPFEQTELHLHGAAPRSMTIDGKPLDPASVVFKTSGFERLSINY